jgi:transcriptional regulator with XRE-family HTH domain
MTEQSTLKALRVQAGLSREALGRLCGRSSHAILTYEANHAVLPRHTADSIANHLTAALGVAVDPQWLYLPASECWLAETSPAAREAARKEYERQTAGLPLFTQEVTP